MCVCVCARARARVNACVCVYSSSSSSSSSRGIHVSWSFLLCIEQYNKYYVSADHHEHVTCCGWLISNIVQTVMRKNLRHGGCQTQTRNGRHTQTHTQRS